MLNRYQKKGVIMKYAMFTLFALGLTITANAEDTPLLAIPGKIIFESKLDAAPGEPWKAAKGKWELIEGVWRGSEKPEDKHGAVTRLPNKLPDFIIEYEFKFEGAKATSLSINAPKGHMARIAVMTNTVTVLRDDYDKDGPAKAAIFGRFPVIFANSTWHKVRMEMVGDTVLGKVDDLIAWGKDDFLKNERVAPGITVSGQSVDFRNFTIREGTLNPNWDKMKATLPATGVKK